MSIFGKFIDLLYPSRCLICRAFLDQEREPDGGSGAICATCLGSFSRLVSPTCPICGRPFLSGIQEDHVCEECLRKRPFFEKTAAPYVYDGPIMDAIHRFKYQGKAHMAKALGPLLASFGKDFLVKETGVVIMPVPLHPKRLRQRGYNQSLLLARHLAQGLGFCIDFMSLRRVRDTQVQTGLKREERRKNVKKAFEVVDRRAVKGKTILLVDDVATTGSTLNECARVLRKAGCEKVYGLVLARAPLQ